MLLRYGVELALLFAVVALAGTLLGVFHVLAVSGSLLWVIPQVLTTLREKDLSGVSVPAYVLLAVENAGWVLYAWGTRTPAYALAPLVQGPLAVFIAIYAFRAHRSATSAPIDCKRTPQVNASRIEADGQDQISAKCAASNATFTSLNGYDDLVREVALDCRRS
jgi:uncharacterized protein with PQ loop repeat